MRFGAEEKTVLSCGLAIALLTVNGYFTFRAARDYLATGASERQSVQVRMQAAEFLSHLKDAETGQRGFLLTGENAYLTPYQESVDKVTTSLERLRHEVRPEQRPTIDAIAPLVEQKLAELRRTLDLRNDQGLSAALAVVRSGEGKDLMNRIRGQLRELEAQELQASAELSGVLETQAATARSWVVISSVLAIGLLITAAVVLHYDLRKLRSIEVRLREQKSVLECILESIGDGVVVCDAAGRFLAFNPAAEQILGIGPGDVPWQQWPTHFGVYLPDQKTLCPAEKIPLARALRGEPTDAAELYVRNDQRPEGLWLSVTGRPLCDTLSRAGGGVVVFSDNTRRKRLEAELTQYRMIVDGIQDYAICLLDTAGHVVTWNRGAELIKGYKPHEIIGKHVSTFFPAEEVTLGRPKDELRVAQEAGRFEDENWRVRKDGSRFWASVLLTALYGEKGELIGFAKVTRDLSERKKAEEALREAHASLEKRVRERTAELAKANAELLQKHQENELFVYSVSHDLRSPLVNLQGFSQELAASCRELRDAISIAEVPESTRRHCLAILDADAVHSISYIQSAVTRLESIINALLRLSRAGKIEYQWQSVPVDKIVHRIIDSSHADIEQRGAEVELGPLPDAWGDPTAVEQVFANLVSNALKYLDPERPGHIKIGGFEPASGCRTYYVRDNGLGIPTDGQAKIFRAFQRLHPKAAEGEGIGLAVVSRIVERHGGRTWLESKPGEGSTFFVSFPPVPKTAN